MLKKRMPEIIRFIKFGCVGVVNTLVDYAVYALVIGVFGKEHYLIANLLGFVAGTLNAYFMNGRFVFHREDGQANRGKRQLLRTFLGYGVTFLLSEGLLKLWVDGFGINEYLAKLMNLCVTVPLNYIINKLWTFRK